MAKEFDALLSPGDVINDTYRVIKFIGRGAFGEVYRVKHRVFGNQAMKVFTSEYVKHTDLEALQAEAILMSRLTQKNIVRVFEANTFLRNGDSHPFITMEFVSGESLAKLLRRKINLEIVESVSIQMAFLRGLSETHRHRPPIVHRDISPDNILLSYDSSPPRALIADFGLAQSVEQLSGIAEVAGKYLYLAPECFWGAYLPRSDVFASGIVFYRMLTGAFPWQYDFSELQGSSMSRVSTLILKAQKTPPARPSTIMEYCPPGLEEIVMTSLALDLEDRFHDASEFLDALSALSSSGLFRASSEEAEKFLYV